MALRSSNFRKCSSLADDILIEIFSYLPLTSIYKFKSVSKVWLSILSNPDFIIKWFEINKESLPWILYHTIMWVAEEDAFDNDYAFYYDNSCRSRNAYSNLHSKFMSKNRHLFCFGSLMNEKSLEGAELFPLDSSNGLVLCYSLGSDDKNRYHVCNPLTQTWVSFPSPTGCDEGHKLDIHRIFCECSSSFPSCYKVVCIPGSLRRSKKFSADIFSSDLGVWKFFEVSCDKNVTWGQGDSCTSAVILNGVLFWIEQGKRMLAYSLNQSDGHRCSLIDLPDDGFDNDVEYYDHSDSILGESEGWICYAEARMVGMLESDMSVSVWVLDGVNWKILHKDISVDDFVIDCCEATKIQVLGFSPEDRNVVLFGCKHWVHGFNLQTESLEDICLDNSHVYHAGRMFSPFVLKPMPTILPPPSW